jgi:chemotaxis protein MotB
MPDDKLARVVGMGSSQLLEPEDPLNPINRRIGIVVMTREAEERLMGARRTNVTNATEPTTTLSHP